jgi:hypothetical protein
MCVAVWFNSPCEARIGMLSEGGGIVTFGVTLGPPPEPSFVRPLPVFGQPAPDTLSP